MNNNKQILHYSVNGGTRLELKSNFTQFLLNKYFICLRVNQETTKMWHCVEASYSLRLI